jgi:hypothetical protein
MLVQYEYEHLIIPNIFEPNIKKYPNLLTLIVLSV